MQAWKPSRDTYPHQDSGCVGPANKYPHSFAYCPAQFDADTIPNCFSYGRHIQSQSTFTYRYPTTNGHAAVPIEYPHTLTAHRNSNTAGYN